MATSKKNFLNALEAGTERDQQMRQSSKQDRFARAEATLEGRASLLHEPESTDTEARSSASFYVETAVKEGRASMRAVQRIPLTQLRDNPLNSRRFYNEAKIEARANSMRSRGQLTPILVAPDPKNAGGFIAIDGHYRKRAAHRLAWVDMDCLVVDGLNGLDFYHIAHASNNEREAETVLDNAFVWRQIMLDGYARTEEDLIPITGASKSTINKTLALADLPETVIDVINQKPDAFGISVAYELTLMNRAAGEDQTVALAERIRDEGLPFKKVEAIRKKAEEGTKAKRNTSRQYKIRRGNTVVGTIKEWDNGRVTFDMTFDDATKREAYVSNLKQQFDLEDDQV